MNGHGEDSRSDVPARLAISAVLANYCRAMDRLDEELALSCWHRDATVDYGTRFVGPAKEFVNFALALHRTWIRHSHQITNTVIKLSGTRAVSEAYGTVAAWLEVDDVPIERVSRVRYLDRWLFDDDRWSIERRVTVKDTSSDHELRPRDYEALAPWHRDDGDPSYHLFRSID